MFFFLMIRRPPRSTLLSLHDALPISVDHAVLLQILGALKAVGQLLADGLLDDAWAGEADERARLGKVHVAEQDRKSTRLNSSHANISYAVFCLKKKNNV